MQKSPDWIVVGRFGRVHGVRGAIRLHSFTEDPAQILRYKAWCIYQGDQWIPVERLEEQLTSKGVVVKIKGYETRELAAQLTHIKVGVQQTQLAPLEKGEFYCFELIGMNVFNGNKENIGQVTDIMPTGQHDVLIIQGEKRHLIPYLPGRVIKQIDRAARCISVEWDDDF